jgi:hypothetical protein
MVISEQCQNGRCRDCPELLDLANGVKCGHNCHLNTLNIASSMDQALRQQIAEQEEIDPLTPNKPHIA